MESDVFPGSKAEKPGCAQEHAGSGLSTGSFIGSAQNVKRGVFHSRVRPAG